MRIGLTYDLRSEYLAAGYGEEETAEFDRADTIDSIEGALRRSGTRPTASASAAVVGGWRQATAGTSCSTSAKDCAARPRGPGAGDSRCLWHPYTFADPLVMALSLHKGLTKTVVREQVDSDV